MKSYLLQALQNLCSHPQASGQNISKMHLFTIIHLAPLKTVLKKYELNKIQWEFIWKRGYAKNWNSYKNGC